MEAAITAHADSSVMSSLPLLLSHSQLYENLYAQSVYLSDTLASPSFSVPFSFTLSLSLSLQTVCICARLWGTKGHY